jgi:hypothetical protein
MCGAGVVVRDGGQGIPIALAIHSFDPTLHLLLGFTPFLLFMIVLWDSRILMGIDSHMLFAVQPNLHIVGACWK